VGPHLEAEVGMDKTTDNIVFFPDSCPKTWVGLSPLISELALATSWRPPSPTPQRKSLAEYRAWLSGLPGSSCLGRPTSGSGHPGEQALDEFIVANCLSTIRGWMTGNNWDSHWLKLLAYISPWVATNFEDIVPLTNIGRPLRQRYAERLGLRLLGCTRWLATTWSSYSGPKSCEQLLSSIKILPDISWELGNTLLRYHWTDLFERVASLPNARLVTALGWSEAAVESTKIENFAAADLERLVPLVGDVQLVIALNGDWDLIGPGLLPRRARRLEKLLTMERACMLRRAVLGRDPQYGENHRCKIAEALELIGADCLIPNGARLRAAPPGRRTEWKAGAPDEVLENDKGFRVVAVETIDEPRMCTRAH
jgi:hypothetical protein